jgi:Asp-tRNA(Asn)/Glu-tRNA(Gln) amidotransferase A subunit family amidase
MHNYTIAKLIKGLQNKEFSSVELTQHFLDRISQLNDDYNAVITVTSEQALSAAVLADKRIANGYVWSSDPAQRYLLYQWSTYQLRLKDAGQLRTAL